jgi:hypothetical protein
MDVAICVSGLLVCFCFLVAPSEAALPVPPPLALPDSGADFAAATANASAAAVVLVVLEALMVRSDPLRSDLFTFQFTFHVLILRSYADMVHFF